MSEWPRVAAALGFAWAAVALAWQVRTARAGGRRDYSRAAGDPGRGMLFALTTAMLPKHKESVRLHPGKFAIGMLLHLGALAALAAVLALVLGAGPARVLGCIAAVGLPTGLFLFVRRLFSPVLRAMSVPEDHLAILSVCALAAGAGLFGLGLLGAPALLAYAALFLLYLPLGKLRHVVFFFVARADHGRRLGYRGTYPLAHHD